jgi:hypothetical protein
MNPTRPVKPDPGPPAAQASTRDGLPIITKRQIKIVPQPQGKRPPRPFGPAQRLIAAYVILSSSTPDKLAEMVGDKILQQMQPYGPPVIFGNSICQAVVSYQKL